MLCTVVVGTCMSNRTAVPSLAALKPERGQVLRKLHFHRHPKALGISHAR